MDAPELPPISASEESTVPGPEASVAPTSDRSDARRMRAQLYLLPLLIVVLLVGGWMFVSWLLHADQDPQSLVRGMQEPGLRSWQNAFALSQLLNDPDHDALKDDVPLCRELVAILAKQNRLAAANGGVDEDDEHARFRIFLCRALSAFRLPHGLPALLVTAASPAGPHDPAVRAAAVESIAVLADNIGTDALLANPQTLRVLLDASYDESANDVELAATATYVLGIVGGPQAIERLIHLIDDPRENVRYNAATGLARHGNVEALPVLLEMLDPQNHETRRGDESDAEESDTDRQRRQTLVIRNGIRAAECLSGVASPTARRDLSAALRRLSDFADLPAPIRLQAKEAFLRLQRQQ